MSRIPTDTRRVIPLILLMAFFCSALTALTSSIAGPVQVMFNHMEKQVDVEVNQTSCEEDGDAKRLTDMGYSQASRHYFADSLITH